MPEHVLRRRFGAERPRRDQVRTRRGTRISRWRHASSRCRRRPVPTRSGDLGGAMPRAVRRSRLRPHHRLRFGAGQQRRRHAVIMKERARITTPIARLGDAVLDRSGLHPAVRARIRSPSGSGGSCCRRTLTPGSLEEECCSRWPGVSGLAFSWSPGRRDAGDGAPMARRRRSRSSRYRGVLLYCRQAGMAMR